MIFAHLPAGYIVSVLAFKQYAPGHVRRLSFVRAGMFGAIAPDLDMFYFYTLDQRAHSHHSYFSHFPIVWLLLLTVAWLCLRRAEHKTWSWLLTIFAGNGLLHMLLDYCASNIYWLAPFVVKPFSLWADQGHYQPWWLNVLLYRSLLLEFAIVAWAVRLRWGQWPWQSLGSCGARGLDRLRAIVGELGNRIHRITDARR